MNATDEMKSYLNEQIHDNMYLLGQACYGALISCTEYENGKIILDSKDEDVIEMNNVYYILNQLFEMFSKVDEIEKKKNEEATKQTNNKARK